MRARCGPLVAGIYGARWSPTSTGSSIDRTPTYAREIGPDELLVLAAAAMLHVALGAVVGRWPVLLAPALPVLIAIPAGDYPGGWPEGLVAAVVAFQMLLFGVPLVTLSVVLR